jgi:hypothetical protein
MTTAIDPITIRGSELKPGDAIALIRGVYWLLAEVANIEDHIEVVIAQTGRRLRVHPQQTLSVVRDAAGVR